MFSLFDRLALRLILHVSQFVLNTTGAKSVYSLWFIYVLYDLIALLIWVVCQRLFKAFSFIFLPFVQFAKDL